MRRAFPLRLMGVLVGGLFTLLGAGCYQPPAAGKAADPQTVESNAPIMGGATNHELKKKVGILEDFLDGKLSAAELQKRIDAEFSQRGQKGEKASPEGGPEDQRSAEDRVRLLREALGSASKVVAKGRPMPKGPDRDMVMARFYFSERRFVEAGELLSSILDRNPEHPEARNLLARCFYFLGNPDRTLQELELRLAQLDKRRLAGGSWGDQEAYEYVDALFLVGAAVLESPGTTRENLERGKRVWEMYLEMAPNSEAAGKVKEGLAEIDAGLRGEGRLAQAPTVRQAAAMGSSQGVKGGAASFDGAGGGMAGPAPKDAQRVKNLPPDASPFDRAVATALDALDMRDAATAMEALEAAEQAQPGTAVVAIGRARAKVQIGAVPEALQLYGEIIKRWPKDPMAWHYLGMAHMMSGDPAQAVQSWEQLKEIDPTYFANANLERRVEVAKRMAQGR